MDANRLDHHETQTRIATVVGLALLCVLVLVLALYGSFPYGFYIAMRWTIAASTVYIALASMKVWPAAAPLVVGQTVIAGIHFFSRMHRSEWAFFNWAGIAVFGLTAILFSVRYSKTGHA